MSNKTNALTLIASVLTIILCVLAIIWLSADVAYSRGWNEALFACDTAALGEKK